MPIPPLHPPKQSDHVASILYIADFLTQFSKVLAIKPVTFQDLCASLHPGTSPNALLASNTATAAGGRLAAAAAAKLAGSAAVGGAGRSQATALGVNASTTGLSNGVSQQSGAVCGSGGGKLVADGSGALFDLYRGLLQFLLQVMRS